MSILIKNIKELVQVEEIPRLKVAGREMAELNTIKDAWLLIEGDRIVDFGKMSELDDNYELRITNYEKDPDSSHDPTAHQLISFTNSSRSSAHQFIS